ncbi:MAG: quinone-dependent dihydroorotate dehydrogenase [Chitinophagaceae bacterium]|nr:MAG: quinone-dependent dihydroorotate dehydrogenase [Chitinophagaceae bacterium]
MYKSLLRSILFKLDAEDAHNVALKALKIASSVPGGLSLIGAPNKNLTYNPIEVCGLNFPNRLGLAAGFDKDALYFPWLFKLGFGFIEVGTLTPRPQQGNPKPRLFRLKKDRAIVNRMGFNNAGVDAAVLNLKKWRNKFEDKIIGGNIGKNKDTPNENAVQDYLYCFEKLYPYVDYFTVNVSSPNTPGLRELQDKEPLTRILSEVNTLNHKKTPKPIFLKIAPDLNDTQFNDIIDIVGSVDIQGIIATNTTIDKSNLIEQQKSDEIGMGGLSGKPLLEKSNEITEKLRSRLSPDKTIIGVGGILNGTDAKKKIDCGADLIQVYSGFVYEGPALIKNILKSI